jgi:GxxExxY protein
MIHKTTLSESEEEVATKIVDAAYNVHKNLGPGLLENVYEICFCHELTKRDLRFQRQVNIPINYDGIQLAEGLRLDLLVEDMVICELKAVEIMPTIYTAQLLTYLKLSGKRLGFLINFNVAVFKQGIKRVVLKNYSCAFVISWLRGQFLPCLND